METKEKKMEEEKSTANEELLNKKEILSDEQLSEVAAGERSAPYGCVNNCMKNGMSREECTEICK